MLTLEIKDISLSYNHQPVVKDLSFQVNQGEILGLLGPNGCGKTSVIRAMSRTLALRAGSILLNGVEIGMISRSELARRIGIVPQSPGLPETFTVLDVVLLGRNPHLGLLRNESSRDLAIAKRALEKTGISALAERKIGELSGGEKQRVSIALVLAQEPEIVLLDEPTANLDINHQVEILNLMKNLCHERNLAVLIAIHDLNLAAQYCDRLLLMKNGRAYAAGSPAEVITRINIKEVFGASSYIYPHPDNNLPVVLPCAGPESLKRSGGKSK